jgi:hypothetical protein
MFTDHSPTATLAWTEWDGVTTMNPCTNTAQDVINYIWPNGNAAMRGLAEVYDQVQPFLDPANPTVKEVEDWNLEVIRHFRRLMGFSEENNPLSHDQYLYYRTQIAWDRKKTDHYDSKYPGELDSRYGPCIGGTWSHCGWHFVPNCEDQSPYFLRNTDECFTLGSGEAESILTGYGVARNWGQQMSDVIRKVFTQDGWAGHTPQLATAKTVGLSWNGTASTVRIISGAEYGPSCP